MEVTIKVEASIVDCGEQQANAEVRIVQDRNGSVGSGMRKVERGLMQATNEYGRSNAEVRTNVDASIVECGRQNTRWSDADGEMRKPCRVPNAEVKACSDGCIFGTN